MKKSGLITKLVLLVFFFVGFCLICNVAIALEETEEIEGIVEKTYTSGAMIGSKPTTSGISKVPMCRVVWYDKNGEQVVYGMPNDKDYTVGDSYFIKVDSETNRIPQKSMGEAIVAATIGVIIWVGCGMIWHNKFGKKRKYGKR